MIQYQVDFGTAISRAFSNYFNFNGRASRSEYWYFILFCAIVNIALRCGGLLAFGLRSPFSDIFAAIFSLVILIPQLTVFVRRMHDIGRSGWNWFWSLLPVIGWVILLVYECTGSQMEENQYGPVPNVE